MNQIYGIFSLQNEKRVLHYEHGLFASEDAISTYMKKEGLQDCWPEKLPVRGISEQHEPAVLYEQDWFVMNDREKVVYAGLPGIHAAQGYTDELRPGTYYLCQVGDVVVIEEPEDIRVLE